jgi:hypothetical protein
VFISVRKGCDASSARASGRARPRYAPAGGTHRGHLLLHGALEPGQLLVEVLAAREVVLGLLDGRERLARHHLGLGRLDLPHRVLQQLHEAPPVRPRRDARLGQLLEVEHLARNAAHGRRGHVEDNLVLAALVGAAAGAAAGAARAAAGALRRGARRLREDVQVDEVLARVVLHLVALLGAEARALVLLVAELAQRRRQVLAERLVELVAHELAAADDEGDAQRLRRRLEGRREGRLDQRLRLLLRVVRQLEALRVVVLRDGAQPLRERGGHDRGARIEGGRVSERGRRGGREVQEVKRFEKVAVVAERARTFYRS